MGMKIYYDMTSKEYFKFYNQAMGIFLQKRKIKKNPMRRIKTSTQIIIGNYLLCFLYIPFIVFFDSFVSLGFLSFLFSTFFLLGLIFNTFFLFLVIVNFVKANMRVKKGELCFDAEGILDTAENGGVILKRWNEIDFVYVLEELIFIITKRKVVFFFPVDFLEQKKILEYLETIQNDSSLFIIDKQNDATVGKFEKHFFNWGIYIFSFVLLFFLVMGWDSYHLSILDREIEALYDSNKKIDTTIYSFEKYGIVEKELKNYFNDLQQYRNIYEENSAISIIYLLTAEYLEKHRDELPDLLQNFSTMENITENAIQKLIELFDEEKAMEKIRYWNLGEVYDSLYKDYISDFVSNQFRRQWEKELYENHLRMQYLTRMLEILTSPHACWEISNNYLYFCDDIQLKEYNELYDRLMENNKEPSVGIKM